MHRLLTRVAAVALAAGAIVPVTTAIVSSGGNAYAGGTQISCTKLAGNATTTTISKCSGPAPIIGSKPGKGTATTVISCSSCGGWNVETTSTWGKGGAGGTDTAGANYVITGPGVGTPCGKKASTITETGSVLSGTGAAAALTGDTSTATVCYNGTKNTIKNAKGTTVDT
jgi:hypothetical protein